MRVTLTEVAERAGVSRSAVSRAFTEGASISEKTRKKVLRAAQELGYQTNILASSLTTRRTKLVGLIADNIRNPLFLVVIDLFTRIIQEKGFRPLLVNLAGETDPEASVKLLKQYSVDGVIVASSTLPTSFALAFRDAGLPVVHCFGRYSAESSTHVVGVDNVYCGKLAAQTLFELGYRKIGFVGGPRESTSTQDRLRGFKEYLATKKLPVDVNFAQSYSYDAGYRAMLSRIAQGGLPDALFCGDDVVAVGAMDAIAETGLKIPDDIGIIGFNDMEMSGWRCIDLTTIRQPIQNIIAASVDLIISLIRSPEATPETRLLPCEVVQRSTLRPQRLGKKVAHEHGEAKLGSNHAEEKGRPDRKKNRAQANRSGQFSD